MNKIVFLGLAVAVLVGSGGVYLLNKDKKPLTSSSNSSAPEISQSNSVNQSNEVTVEGNLQTLRSDGQARECNLSYSGEDGSGTGKMYTDGKGRGRMQIDLTTARGNAGQSNTLIESEKVYSWTTTDGGSFGFVTQVSSVQTNSTGSPTTSSSQTAGKNFEMTCKNWNVDETVLSVPADVNFTPMPGS